MFYIGEDWKTFLRAEASGVDGRFSDWSEGEKIFLRLDDLQRSILVADLIRAWRDQHPLNRMMVSAALRHAWDSEPYLNGVRLGSYVSFVASDEIYGDDWEMWELAETWGPSMMRDKEGELLKGLTFPLTVYRGGVGDPDEVLQGISWTRDLGIASFYAKVWPKRWGDNREPVILSLSVERKDVVAYLDDRQEMELLIPRAPNLRSTMSVIADQDPVGSPE